MDTSKPSSPVVVVTGSTRGLGRGRAAACIARGCSVVVSGRRQSDAERVAAALGPQALGVACDVTRAAQCEALWQAAVARFGRVDIWINNAGIAAQRKPVWEQTDEEAGEVLDINLTGTLNGARAALRGMRAQGFGRLFNMEGYGSNGMVMAGMAAYGSSKAAVTYLTKSLAVEVKGTPIQVRALSPGMVDTELLRRDYAGDPAAWERAKRAINTLADKVDTVAPWLADQVLASNRNGGRIAWLTTPKIAWRFATARIKPRHIIDAP